MGKKQRCRILTEKQLNDMYSMDLNSSITLGHRKNDQCRFLRRYIRRVSGLSKKLEQQIRADYNAMGCSKGKLTNYLEKKTGAKRDNTAVFAAVGIIVVVGILVYMIKSGVIKLNWPSFGKK